MTSGVADMGMVWMGAGQPSADMSLRLVGCESNDMLLEQENMYYTPSNHSLSNHSIDDLHTIHGSQMVSNFKNRIHSQKGSCQTLIATKS